MTLFDWRAFNGRMQERERRRSLDALGIDATCRRYEIALRNIAGGYWNAGRAECITARDYAREALDPSGCR